jgi:hypothetical protein
MRILCLIVLMIFCLGETTAIAQTSKPKGRAARSKARKDASGKADTKTEPVPSADLASPVRVRYSDLATTPKDFKPVFDLPSVAGKTPEEVEKILGKPVKMETVENKGRTLPKYRYAVKTPLSIDTEAPKDHDIVYIDGKADWIGITGTGSMTYASDEVLKCVNIPPGTAPDNVSTLRIRWEKSRLPGYLNAYAFPDDSGKVLSIYVNVLTEP